MDAPRESDGQHAPETPKANASRPAFIFHFNSIRATLALRPNHRRNATTTQTSAVQHTAGIEKKTHLEGEFRRHKSSGLAAHQVVPPPNCLLREAGYEPKRWVMSADRK